MKYLVSVYCEGSETKAVVLSKDKDEIIIHSTVAVDITSGGGSGSAGGGFDLSLDSMSDDFAFDSVDNGMGSAGDGPGESDIAELASKLYEYKLSDAEFIPVISEPVLSYHIYEGEKVKDRKKLLLNIISDIYEAKGISVTSDNVDYIEYTKNHLLCPFIEDGIPVVDQINALANFNKRRYYKIPTLKSAELSLEHLVGKTQNFFPEDYTLVIYTGKEFSKLIFMEGNKLSHIGSTLDIGTQNLHTYDVYFSKILLEMENGGIPRLDNVILCGEDNSENLILSFYGTFPEANVNQLKFENFNTSHLAEEEQEKLSSFTIPVAAAVEYFDELDKKHQGINLLPKFIKENQKMLQFGWHSYAIMPLLFAVTFFFTFSILSKYKAIEDMDKEIVRLTQLQIQNQAILDQMSVFNQRIDGFGATQKILDEATVGSELWGKNLERISNFMERRRNFWISRLNTSANNIEVSGYSMSRKALTEFADYNNASQLQNIIYDPMRERNTFNFLLNFNFYNQRIE